MSIRVNLIEHNRVTTMASVVMCLFLLSASFVPLEAAAHGNENHSGPGVNVENTAGELTNSPFPIDVGGPFSLIDHDGNAVSDQTYGGMHTLVFFGYTNCQVMCSISLRRIGDALQLLSEENGDLLTKLAPLVVTVDPNNDTPEKLKESLASFHPALIGLTGTSADLTKMYRQFNQSPTLLDNAMNGKAVVQHASYFHLMSPNGKFQTMFPPILNAESMATILKKYIR